MPLMGVSSIKVKSLWNLLPDLADLALQVGIGAIVVGEEGIDVVAEEEGEAGMTIVVLGTGEDVVGATTAALDAMMTTVLVAAAAEIGTTMTTVAGVEEDIVMTAVVVALAAVVVVQHTVVAAAGKLDVQC